MQDHSEKSMVDLFVELEQTLPVNTYEINGVNAWPYIRLSIKNKIDSHFLYHNGGKGSRRLEPTFFKKCKNTLSALKQALVSTVQSALVFPFKRFYSTQQYDVLMFCFNASYMSVGENEINRNLIGILSELEKAGNNRYQILEYTSLDEVREKPNFPGMNIAQYTASLNDWCKFQIALAECFPKRELPFVTEINRILRAKNIPVQLESHKLKYEFQRILRLAAIMQGYLLRHKVKKVVNVCYYGYVGMAVDLACYRENCHSIEYQHGVQTENHPLYSHWSNVPENGYELLPKSFWVWGDATKANIQKWVENQHYHDAKTVGNAWLPYFSEQIAGTLSLTPTQQARYANKKVILVSLQAFPEHYRTYVTDAMKQSDDNWLWVLKEHPRSLISDDDSETYFGNLLRQGKVIIERDFTLYEMLALLPINVHLTAYSTVAFECEYYNIPTVFFHENGVNGNAKVIQETEHFSAGLDASSLLKNIKLALDIKTLQPIYMAKQVTVAQDLFNTV